MGTVDVSVYEEWVAGVAAPGKNESPAGKCGINGFRPTGAVVADVLGRVVPRDVDDICRAVVGPATEVMIVGCGTRAADGGRGPEVAISKSR
jgi:hypothetical protein